MPTRSISSRFIQTSIHDSGIPHDPHREFSNTQRRVLFLPPKRSAFKAGSLLFGSFILFGFAFVSGPMPYRSPDRSKGSLKQHVCTVPTKRNVRALMGGKKTLRLVGKKSPCHFFCPMQERFGQQELAFTRLWQLEEAVMSAILGWTVQCAICRHLSSFSS